MASQPHIARLALFATLALSVCVLLVLPLSAAPADPDLSPDIVISQIYGGAGCTTAGCSTYKNDYIELFNRGSSSVALNGWSVQYAAATSSNWQVTQLPNINLAPGQYLLVQQAGNANGVNPLPTPDVIDTTALSRTAGKVALVSDDDELAVNCPDGGKIVDFVGYGAAADCSETANAPASGKTRAIFRSNNGCTDTDNNSSDFAAAAPVPRNTSSSKVDCSSNATATTSPTSTETATPTDTLTPSSTPTATATPSDPPTPSATPTATVLPGGIHINEFLPDPASDWDGAPPTDESDEWVELFNSNPFAIDVSGWKLDDVEGGGSAPYIIPANTMIPGQSFLLLFNVATGVTLNNDGDDVRLLYPDDTTADAVSYNTSSPDQSWGRYPDGAASFTNDCIPTPSAPNCSITPTPTMTPTPFPKGVFVNEFLSAPYRDWNHDGTRDSGDEWIELYNAGSQPIDLSGWMLDDGKGGSTPFALPANTIIAAHRFIRFFGSETGIGLNNDGDKVRLLFPDGSVADSRAYDGLLTNQSEGRYPDGSADWYRSCEPTPGEPNCSKVAQPTATPEFELTSIAEARQLPDGEIVSVLGSVIARPCELDTYGHELTLSDGAAGIDVYLEYPNRLSCLIPRGEQLVVTGVIGEHFGLKTIYPRGEHDIVRHYAPPREIAPRLIHTGEVNDQVESVLLMVQGTVSNGKNGDVIWVNDGTGGVEVYADPASGVSFEGITRGSAVRIVGIGFQYNKDKLPEEGYYLRPRAAADVVVLELADKLPEAPGGRGGADLGTVAIEQAYTTKTQNYATFGGIVTVPPNVIAARDFWIQDAHSGVRVFVASSAGAVPQLELNDAVTVRGRIVTAFGARQVRVELDDGITVFGKGEAVTPTSLSTGEVTLDREGKLVTTAGRIVHVRGREVKIDDGTGEVLVYLDANTKIRYPKLEPGGTLQVTGVVVRFDGEPEILPRFQSDVVFGVTLLPVAGTRSVQRGLRARARVGEDASEDGLIRAVAGAQASRLEKRLAQVRRARDEATLPDDPSTTVSLVLVCGSGLTAAAALLLYKRQSATR